MFDALTNEFHQDWKYASREHRWHTNCSQANTDEESSAEMNGYLGRGRGLYGQPNLPEGKLVSLLHLIRLHGERM